MPSENLHMSVGIFDKGAAAFNPVSVVEVEDATDHADLGMVDMAAHHAVHAAHRGFTGHGLLEAGDIFDRILHFVFEPSRQRPIGQAETLAQREQRIVEAQRHAIGPVADMGEPFGIGDHPVEAIAMQHPKPLAVGAVMDGLMDDLDAAELDPTEDLAPSIIAGKLIVIAGHEDDAGAGIDLAQDFGHHLVLCFGPVPAALELPAIDNVADQIERVAVVMGQKVGQRFGLAARRSKMGVGNKDGAMAREAAGVGNGLSYPGKRWNTGSQEYFRTSKCRPSGDLQPLRVAR